MEPTSNCDCNVSGYSLSYCATHGMTWAYYMKLIKTLKIADDQGSLKQLAQRLAEAEEAKQILSAKGYEGSDIAEQVKKIPPASLKHS